MKIWVLSDLHLERDQWFPPAIPDADVCIAAGDIDRGAMETVHFLAAEIRPHMPVVAVLGNHEMYGHRVELERSEAAYRASKLDVQMLDDSSFVIEGTRFVGGTLWTDFALFGTLEKSMAAALRGMTDFSGIIAADGKRFSPEASIEMHKRTVAYMDEVLSQPFNGETVVVTHHGPSPLSMGDWDDDPCTPAFHSDLTWLIEKHRPALWVHGHTHNSHDYQIGATRVVCNPRGYGAENARDFDPALVVEIGELRPKPRW